MKKRVMVTGNRWLGICLVIAMLGPVKAMAGITCTNNPRTTSLVATIPSTPITTVGSPSNRYLTDWFYGPASGYSALYSGCNAFSTATHQERVSNLTPTGSSIDGYPIFKTNVQGVGIIVKGRDRADEPGAALGSDWTKVVTGTTTFWDGSFGARLVSTTETIVSGTVSGLGTIGQLRVVDPNDVVGSSSIIPINLVVNGTLTFTSKTCSVSANSRNISVPLGKVNSNAITTTGSSLANGSFTINLDSCTTGLKVNMTFSDQNMPANTSNALTLTQDGQQASGVGIRIINQATQQPVYFGPDSAVVGNPNQFIVVTTTGPNVSIPFSATYVKTGAPAIVGGTANGVATFTMSYQ